MNVRRVDARCGRSAGGQVFCGWRPVFRDSVAGCVFSGWVDLDNDTLLSVESLSFGYTPERLILKDISMKFRRGSVVALMGGSGSGKTTVLRLIAAQLQPLSGKVLVNGIDVHSLGKREIYKARRHLGMLFQFGALFTDLDIFDNVAFPLREQTDLPEPMIRDLVLMKLNAVGLRGAAHLMPSQISGGMARRVALARSIALDPQLLMYDEPFAGLDPISLGTIAHLIRTLNDALGDLLDPRRRAR